MKDTRTRDLPSIVTSGQNNTQRQITSNDHDYAVIYPQITRLHHNRIHLQPQPLTTITQEWHASSPPPSPGRTASPAENAQHTYAINNNILDFTIQRNQHEQNDLLTFLLM